MTLLNLKESFGTTDNKIMLHNVVEIAEENRSLSLSRGFLVIRHKDEVLGKVPLDSIEVLILTAQSASITKPILNALSEKGCVTILCGKNYVPFSVVLPIAIHSKTAKILKTQIDCSSPFRKRLWQKIVVQKILNQARTLFLCGKGKEAKTIEKIASSVKSGDSENREAYAARLYWQFLFGKDFKRDREEQGINALLNYGYAVMRAAVARAVCASGLNPSLGLFHKNALNQFCLVDDLFEVYRPIVDFVVFSLAKENMFDLIPETKARLAEVLLVKVYTSEGESSAAQSMQYLAFSYVNSLESKQCEMEFPEWSDINAKFDFEQV